MVRSRVCWGSRGNKEGGDGGGGPHLNPTPGYCVSECGAQILPMPPVLPLGSGRETRSGSGAPGLAEGEGHPWPWGAGSCPQVPPEPGGQGCAAGRPCPADLPPRVPPVGGQGLPHSPPGGTVLGLCTPLPACPRLSLPSWVLAGGATPGAVPSAEQNSRGSCPVSWGGGSPQATHFWGRVLGRERVCVIGGQGVQGGWPLKGLVVEILTGAAGLMAQVTLSGSGGRAPSPCVDPRLSQESAAPFPAASAPPPPLCGQCVSALSLSLK